MKKLVMILLVVAIAASGYLLSKGQVTLNKEDIYLSKYAQISKEEWLSFDASKSHYPEVEDLLLAVDGYVEKIADQLGRDQWVQDHLTKDKITLKFYTMERSQASGGGVENNKKFIRPVISLSERSFEDNWYDLTHELTHIISPYAPSTSLSEGLACFLQDELSLTNQQFLGDAREISKYLIDHDYDYLLDYIGHDENLNFYTFGSDKKEVQAFYILSASFSRYLIETYGMDIYLVFYESECDELSYVKAFNLERNDLIDQYLQSLISE